MLTLEHKNKTVELEMSIKASWNTETTIYTHSPATSSSASVQLIDNTNMSHMTAPQGLVACRQWSSQPAEVQN